MSYDDLMQKYRSGQIDRRALLRGLAALAAPALGAAVVAESAMSRKKKRVNNRTSPAGENASYRKTKNLSTYTEGGGNAGQLTEGQVYGGGNADEGIQEQKEIPEKIAEETQAASEIFDGGNAEFGTSGSPVSLRDGSDAQVVVGESFDGGNASIGEVNIFEDSQVLRRELFDSGTVSLREEMRPSHPEFQTSPILWMTSIDAPGPQTPSRIER